MALGSCVAILPKPQLCLIQQCCWVLPKQKAWLHSPPLMLGKSCSRKLPQQPSACSVPSCNTDGQQPGFGLYKSMGMRKSQPAKKLLFSPSPTSSQNPSSQMCPSVMTRAVLLFVGQMVGVTRWVANCFLLMKHAVRGGSTCPSTGLCSSPRGMTDPGLAAQFPWTRSFGLCSKENLLL